MNKNKIMVSAPGKLILLGEHAVVYDRPVIVTAVDQRLFAEVSISDESDFVLDAPDVNVIGYQKNLKNLGKGEIPKGAEFVEFAVLNFIKKFCKKLPGVRIKTTSQFSADFGFGSSSASVVCVIKALSLMTELNLSNEDLFKISYQAVLDIQGVGSGFDVASAIWGGTIRFVTGGKEIRPIRHSDLPMVVGYTGIKADTAKLVNEVAGKFKNDPAKVNRIFDAISKLVNDSEIELMESDWERVGKFMDFNHEYLRDLGVSSEKLEDLILASKKAGAYGAKLSGAGGGDCMIALVDDNRKNAVIEAITAAGGQVINVGFGAEGVRVETTDNQNELFIVVDENDEIIGYKTRYECHHDPTLIHRTAGVAIYNDKGELLLQKRSLSKDKEPGVYGLSSAGHLLKNDTYVSAAIREMKEELGIETQVFYVGKFLFNGKTEKEMCSVYKGTHNGPFKINEEEVDSVIFISKNELPRKLLSGEIQLTECGLESMKILGFV